MLVGTSHPAWLEEARGRLGVWGHPGQSSVEAARGWRRERFKRRLQVRRIEKRKKEDLGNAKPLHFRNSLCF